MDNEMIERAAQACFEKLCPGIRYTEQDKKFYKEAQVAAIKAMREPTEKMKNALDLAAPMHDDPNTTGEEYWATGIDAIIGEE